MMSPSDSRQMSPSDSRLMSPTKLQPLENITEEEEEQLEEEEREEVMVDRELLIRNCRVGFLDFNRPVNLLQFSPFTILTVAPLRAAS